MRLTWFRKTNTPRQIKLGDLARAFWQEPPVDQTLAKDQGEHLSDPVFENRELQDFWLEYVRPFQTAMPSPVLRAVQDLLAEFEKLAPCPSVLESDPETPQPYRGLTRISLTTHSLAVAREALDLLRVRENDFQMLAGKTLIAALAHDMGKHPSAAVPNMPHSYSSAVWLQKRIGHLREREPIIAAVRLHHAETNYRRVATDNPILPVLTLADRVAREKELAAVAVEQQTEAVELKADDPPLPEIETMNATPGPDDQDAWFLQESFLEILRSRLTCMGFDCFWFDDHVHVSPAVVESILNKLRQEQGLPPFTSRTDIARLFSSRIPEVRNEKYRLRFKNHFSPLKKWFYVFEAALFEPLAANDRQHPRDREGRWLKDMDCIESSRETVPKRNSFSSGTNDPAIP
ncbi:MAG: HD domain-containing protein [Thermodesulfobacteriota bacterium]